MNYFLTIVFLFVIFIIEYLIGNMIENLFDLSEKKFDQKMIFGTIAIFSLAWIIGFPLQIISSSWISFAIIYSILLLLLIIFSFINAKDNINRFSKAIKSIPGRIILNHLSNYWFIYLMVILFTIFSVTNMMPYTLANYTDDAYVVKILHLVGTPHLLNEDYATGNIISNSSITSFLGYRILNTYELTYSYFSTIFHISPVFFCRFTVVIHNFLFCFLSFKLISDIFIKYKYSQFGLIFLSLYLIPAGFAARGNSLIHLRAFENWRTQTAIFYGSSITRICSLPLLTYWFYLLVKEKKSFMIFLGLLVSIFLVSFQTTGISYILLCIPLFILGFILNALWTRYDFNIKLVIVPTIIFILLFLLLFSDQSVIMYIKFLKKIMPTKLANTKLLNFANLNNLVKQYQPYYKDVRTFDIFFKIGFIPLLYFFFTESDKNKLSLSCLGLTIYIIFVSNILHLFLASISFEFFCTARMMSALLFYISMLFGIMIINILQRFNFLKFTSVGLTLVMITSCISCVYTNIDKIKNQYSQKADGVVKAGYSLKTLTDNDKMLDNRFVKIGNYFSKLNKKKYSVFCEDYFSIKGNVYSYTNLLLASPSIQRVAYDKRYKNENIKSNDELKIINGVNWLLQQYFTGKKTYKDIEANLDNTYVDYLFVTRKSVYHDLLNHNYFIVVGNNKDGCWLMKKK